ncbi:hypothetical protein QL093DRAFT_2394895 [Fusarium oxysporum]|nr:hypothetical protein QL093DRAFT_2394895 [Fusarium oxysporum]
MTTISNSDSLPSVFQAFTAEYPNIKVILPGDAEWTDITKSFIKTSSSPSIVARPQNASDVQDLVRFCVSHNIDFVVRSGGHNCTGRSQVNGALTFDMRNINYVNISEDKKTANIGGGIITRELAKALDAEELITTTRRMLQLGMSVGQHSEVTVLCLPSMDWALTRSLALSMPMLEMCLLMQVVKS